MILMLEEKRTVEGEDSALSDPVLRATARLSQRCPSECFNLAKLGTIPLRGIPIMRLEVRYPPQRGHSSDPCAMPCENRAKSLQCLLCDTIPEGTFLSFVLFILFATFPMLQSFLSFLGLPDFSDFPGFVEDFPI